MASAQLEKLRQIQAQVNKIDPMTVQAPPEVQKFADKLKPQEIPIKELWMARMSATKGSIEMTCIWAEGNDGLKKMDDLAKAKAIRFQQELWYKELLADIIGDKEIPF